MSRGKMSSMSAKDVGCRAKWRAIDASPPSASRRVDEPSERKHWSDAPSHPTRYPVTLDPPRVVPARDTLPSCTLSLSLSWNTLALFPHSFGRAIGPSASISAVEDLLGSLWRLDTVSKIVSMSPALPPALASISPIPFHTILSIFRVSQ